MPMTIERHALGPMANFIYLLVPSQGDRLAVVDPAWDPAFLLARAAQLGRPITDILLTHHHADHSNGVEALLAAHPARVHAQRSELPQLRGRGWAQDLVLHDHGDIVDLGAGAAVQLLHTPGHTPGSQCLLCGDVLLTGDTLFIDGCGRCDLPGGDAEAMYRSLHDILGKLDGHVRVLPGHDYGPQPEATLDDQKKTNPYMGFQTNRDFFDYRMRPRG